MPKGTLIPRPKPPKEDARSLCNKQQTDEERLKAEVEEQLKRKLERSSEKMQECASTVTKRLKEIGITSVDLQQQITGGTGGGPRPKVGVETPTTPIPSDEGQGPSTGRGR